jgi:myosin-1
MFGLQGPEAYAYTSLSNCLEVQDIDDVYDYRETIVRHVSLFLRYGAHLYSESHADHWS